MEFKHLTDFNEFRAQRFVKEQISVSPLTTPDLETIFNSSVTYPPMYAISSEFHNEIL